jgi:hypothetical protein
MKFNEELYDSDQFVVVKQMVLIAQGLGGINNIETLLIHN